MDIDIEIIPRLKQFEQLLKLYPPTPSNKFLPEWYKKQKYSHLHNSWGTEDTINPVSKTIKNCPAVREYITDGIIIPAWTDLIIVKNGDTYKWNLTIGNSYSLANNDLLNITNHTNDQTEPLELNNINGYGTLKLTSPYFFKTPKGYGLQFYDPFYHHRNNIRLLPGKVESDIWHEVNFPFEFKDDFNKNNYERVYVKAGQPLLMITPYKKENKYNIVIKKYDQDFIDYQNNNNLINNTISNNWNDYKKIKNEEE